MNKNNLLILLLLIFFISLSSVSAIDNNDTVFTDYIDDDLIQVTSQDLEEEILADSNQITVKDGDSIQSAIDNATEGSTIIVEKGDYSEDITIPKGLTIIGHDANLKSSNVAFMILPQANNTSISGFNIAVLDIDGTGIYINASDCTITDNIISGGGFGIQTDNFYYNHSGEIGFRVINNTVILKNNISNMATAGISINSYNPIVSQNRVTKVNSKRENVTAIGIKVNGIGLIADDLTVKVTDNYVSDIRSQKDSAYGFDIEGNSIFDYLEDFDVTGNVVENVAAAVESYGVYIGIFSLNHTLPTLDISDLNISHISTTKDANSSATGLFVSVTTIGQNESSDTKIHDINVGNMKGSGVNSTVRGIGSEGVGCVDIYITDNKIDSLKASKMITGISSNAIDFVNFKALISISNNRITNLDSSKIKGINVFSMGNAQISKNLLYNIKSGDSTFITAVPLSFSTDNINFTLPANATIEEILEYLSKLEELINTTNMTFNGNLSVFGNNLEGDGNGIAFAVIAPSQIHYNRAVNMKYNVIKDSTRTFLLESNGLDPNLSNEELAYLLLKSQQGMENYTDEEIRNMSKEIVPMIDKLFKNLVKLTAGDVDARYNWWGTNSRPKDSKFKSINKNGDIIYDPWLVMTVKSNPSVIDKGEVSKITVDVYKDSSGKDHSSDAKLYFSGPKVTLSTDIGTFNGKKSITLNWTNGKATAYLFGDESGLATVTATDYDSAFTHVLIRGNDTFKKVHAKTEITMPASGNPFVLLVASVIIILGSAGIGKRK